jgi:predicted amidohydrolase YtcJ
MTIQKLTLALLATALSAAGAPSRAQDAADLLLRRGVFHTVAAAGRVEGSLAVRDGRIVYLGPDEDAEPFRGPDTEVLDLGGRTVVPGLIDAHSHLEGLGAALEQVDLHGTASFEEVIARAVAAAAALPPGTWVQGRGWDQNRWPDARFPHHAALSAALPEHPVWLRRVDGHASLLNQRAMEIVGVDPAGEDPPGGRIERDEQGLPTGVFVDRAADLLGERLPPPSSVDRGRRITAGAAASASTGLTTVTDMGVGPESVAAYRELAAAGALPVRAALFWDGGDPRLPQWLAAGPWRSEDLRVVLRGVKLYADGALGSRGAALLEPYDDDPANLGLVVTPAVKLLEVTRQALEHGFQVGIHAIGDRGNVIALDALEAAFGDVPRPEARCRIEHVQIVRRQDLERMAHLGVIASMQPTHATSDMPWVPARLGAHRLERAYPWRTARRVGAPLALGSDFPVERHDPLLGLYAAVTRQDLQGQPAGGWLPDEALTREEALRGFTLDAAYSLFLDREVGSLEVGKRADLVVFDRDLLTVPPAELLRARALLTVVDGSVIFRHPEAP